MEEYRPGLVGVALSILASEAYAIGKANGFHDHPEGEPCDDHLLRSFARLALITTEVAEATDELRENVVDWVKVVDELSDIIIRTVDLAEVHKLDIGQAVVAKMEKNRKRPYKHGKTF